MCLQYKNVPTYSLHSKKASQELNMILDKHKEYEPLINALTQLPVKLWAYRQRRALLNEKLNYDDETLFLLRTIEKSKYRDILYAVHGYRQEDISKYIMFNTYSKAVLSYCKNNNKQYLALFEDKEHIANTSDSQVLTIEQCLKALDDYVVDDKNIITIAKMMENGASEREMVEYTNKSRTYVRKKVIECEQAYQYLLCPSFH